jgi:hypothetical protein
MKVPANILTVPAYSCVAYMVVHMKNAQILQDITTYCSRINFSTNSGLVHFSSIWGVRFPHKLMIQTLLHSTASDRMKELSEVFAGKTPLSRVERNEMLESTWLSHVKHHLDPPCSVAIIA